MQKPTLTEHTSYFYEDMKYLLSLYKQEKLLYLQITNANGEANTK